MCLEELARCTEGCTAHASEKANHSFFGTTFLYNYVNYSIIRTEIHFDTEPRISARVPLHFSNAQLHYLPGPLGTNFQHEKFVHMQKLS